MRNGKIIKSEFKPAWWCRNRHLQTLFPALFRRTPALKLSNEQLDLFDGDFLDLVWTEEKIQNSPIIILLHGLEGTINSNYVNGILNTITQNNWQGVLMFFRGCSGRHNRLNRSYHSGETGDLHTLVTMLKQRFPGRPIAAIGISLGGNVLLKYLGEQGRQCQLLAAMAVSVPLVLSESALALNKGFSRFYQRYLINSLHIKLRNKYKDKSAPVDLKQLHKWNDFYTFDHNVTAPIHGFTDADDYYTRSSSRQFLKDIANPTFILQSKDDPFITNNSIPTDNELSDRVTFELSEHGGHVGFIYGNNPFNAKYWIEKRLVEFLKKKFEQ